MDRGAAVALQTDHYEITMVASALRSGIAQRRAVFEAFARRLPPGRAYGVVAGTERIIEAVESFRFDAAAVAHLLGAGVVADDDDDAADWLRSYRFSGDVTGYADGELFFPYSPVLTVEGAFADCVVLETVVLSILNHDCAVASAAARVRDAAHGRLLVEGGSRRTDPDAAVAAARSAHIGGFDTTSNLAAGRRYGIPTGGTTAHAFVLAHADERTSFAAQRDALGADSTYLVDTFDVLEGIRGAVDVVGRGIGGVRIDSGNLLAASIRARALLDSLGATRCRIVASGDLDEFRVAELEEAAAPIDAYLVGTSLVTGSGHPTASVVYKLVAVADSDGADAPLRAVGKLSPGKTNVGGRKRVHRTVDADGFWAAEVLSPWDAAGPPDAHNPQVVLIAGGERDWQGDTAVARRRCAERRERLRPEDRAPHPRRSPAIRTEWVGLEALARTESAQPAPLQPVAASARAASAGAAGQGGGAQRDVPAPLDPAAPLARAASAGAAGQGGGAQRDVPAPLDPAAPPARAAPGAQSQQSGRGGAAVRRALMIVDVQNDFCEGGALAVKGGNAVAESIAQLVGDHRAAGSYDYVVASKDWHIDPGEHFAAAGAEPDYAASWPVHCAAGTLGAAFSPALEVELDEVFLKGQYSSGYSGFEGVAGSSDGLGLRDWLAEREVAALDVVGIATDHCVRATALDAAAAGLHTSVLVAHCAGVAQETSAAALEEMAAAGVTIVE